jgi:nitrite reductase/ring-hydroxylating ferredoxin subunit
LRAHAGAAADFEPGRFRVLDLGRRSVGVVRTERGFYAVNARCPHQGADLCAGLLVDGTMVSTRPHEYVFQPTEPLVVCPWHRWEFSLETGQTVGQVTHKRAAVYPVEVVDGEVYVDVPGGAG